MVSSIHFSLRTQFSSTPAWRGVSFQQQRYGQSKSSIDSSPKYDPFDYCVDLVRQRDRESYVCSLVLPFHSRPAAFAIRAFNVELTSVRTMVSNPNTATMRFQFWSSALDKMFDQRRQKSADPATLESDVGTSKIIPSIPQHPVAEALATAVQEKKLSRKWLSELIDSRVERVDERRSFRTIKELEDFYQRTFGSVFFLLLEVNDVRHVHADHASSHLAKALGLVNGLRAINADPERNVRLLPLELLVHHRVSQEDVVRLALAHRRGRNLADDGQANGVSKRLREVIFDLASQAHVHLEHARQLNEDSFESKSGDKKSKKRLHCSTRLVLLPAAIVDHYLHLLQKTDFDIFDRRLGSSYDSLPLALWWRRLLKKF